MEKIKLTNRWIESLEYDSKMKFADASEHYLQLWIGKQSKTFYYCRKIKKKQYHKKIGRWPEMTLAMAREEAAEMSGRVAVSGRIDGVRQKNKNLTLGEAFQFFLANRKPKTINNFKSMWNNHLIQLSESTICDMSRQDVRAIHRDLTIAGKNTTANRVVKLIATIINCVINEEMYEGFNPASRIKLNREEPRSRYLRGNEVKRFLAALEELKIKNRYSIQVDAIKMLLFTGQRKSNVLACEWHEIDFANKEWTIPATKTKQNRVMRVVLAPPVIEILQKRKTGGRYVFPSNCRRSKSGHIGEVRKTFDRACEIADIRDLRLHDLRRTFGSWQANAGASLQVIGDSLGHADIATTERVYAHLGIEKIRDSVEKVVELMIND